MSGDERDYEEELYWARFCPECGGPCEREGQHGEDEAADGMTAERRDGETAGRRDPLAVALRSLATLENGLGLVDYCAARCPGEAGLRCGLANGHGCSPWASDHAVVVRDGHGVIVGPGRTWPRDLAAPDPQTQPPGMTAGRHDGETADGTVALACGPAGPLTDGDRHAVEVFAAYSKALYRAELAEEALGDVQGVVAPVLKSEPAGSPLYELAAKVMAASAVVYDGGPS